jgi:hypothetical protein
MSARNNPELDAALVAAMALLNKHSEDFAYLVVAVKLSDNKEKLNVYSYSDLDTSFLPAVLMTIAKDFMPEYIDTKALN